MTFAQKVKDEIYQSKPLNGKHKRSFAYGLFLFSKHFAADIVAMVTENISVSKLYGQVLRAVLEQKYLPQRARSPRGATVYSITLQDPKEIDRLFAYFGHTEEELNQSLLEEDCLHSFISGVFMACASLSDPIKGYHLEFTPPDEELGDLLFELLSTLGYPPKTTERKGGQWGIYYKESEPIEDLLTIAGATASSLELMEVKIYKDLRNKTNRQSNCDTANIDKIVDAAQQQIADINYLLEYGGEDTLTEPLHQMALLRLQNPDASLRELAELAGVSRSGANHRLSKIAAIAKELRGIKEGSQG